MKKATVIEDLTGKKFGSNTVTSKGPDFSSKGRRWYIRCDCGRERLIGTTELKLARSCDKCTPRKFEDLSGQRFDKRVVLRVASLGDVHHRNWWVRCDCGREFKCLLQDLRRGGYCKLCTPKRKEPRPYRRKRPYEAQYNAWVQRARYPVSVTYEEFAALTAESECHYCGSLVIWAEYNMGRLGTSASNIDRKDSSKPYDLDNIVVCCARCNIGKNTLFSYEEWAEIGEVIKSWGPREIPYFNGHDSRRQNDWNKKTIH